VIVKNGVVYLDGTFPLENIIEEVLVFTTQQNHFDIYIYGDAPISEQPTDGKFSFDPSSVKSFNILPEPLFQRLPTVKAYQLQLVDVVLRQQGIGVFPVKYLVAVIVGLGLIWMGFSYITLHKKSLPIPEIPPPPNPFIEFNNALMTVAPDVQIEMIILSVDLLTTMPGWIPTDISYTGGKLTVNVKSLGTNVEELYAWAERNGATIVLMPGGFSLTMALPLPPKRPVPDKIYPLDRVIMNVIDRMAVFMPGNVVNVGPYKTQRVYKESDLRISLVEASPDLVMMVAQQLKGLPLVLTNLTLKINHGLTGTIVLQALGN
jgi:hypothetical protein